MGVEQEYIHTDSSLSTTFSQFLRLEIICLMSNNTFSNLDKSILKFGEIWSLKISTKLSSIPKDNKFKLRFCQPSFFQAFLGRRLSRIEKRHKERQIQSLCSFKKLLKSSSKKSPRKCFLEKYICTRKYKIEFVRHTQPLIINCPDRHCAKCYIA